MAAKVIHSDNQIKTTKHIPAGVYITINNSSVQFCACSAGKTDRRQLKTAAKTKKNKILTTAEWIEQYLEEVKDIDNFITPPKTNSKKDNDISDEIARELI